MIYSRIHVLVLHHRHGRAPLPCLSLPLVKWTILQHRDRFVHVASYPHSHIHAAPVWKSDCPLSTVVILQKDAQQSLIAIIYIQKPGDVSFVFKDLCDRPFYSGRWYIRVSVPGHLCVTQPSQIITHRISNHSHSNYQLDLRIPGILPALAMSRKAILETPYTRI